MKSVLPEAIRKKEEGWKKQLFVRAMHLTGEFSKLPRRQQEVWNIIEERREMLLTELLEASATTAATVRKLEDRGLVEILFRNFRARPLCPRTHFADPAVVVEPGAIRSAGENQGSNVC